MEKLRGHGDNDDYSHEEDKEKYRAALCVASLKHVKLSHETALALHGLKNKFLRQIRARRNKPRVQTEPNNNNPTHQQNLINAQNLPGDSELNELAALNTYFPPETPPLPMLHGLIGKCSKPFGKQLTGSDVDDGQCRLSINKLDMENAVFPFLKDGEDCNQGIPVTVYDADGKEYPMTLIIWCSKIHVLKEGWKKFRSHHGLVKHQDFITMWVFRKVETEDLCFVITSRRFEIYEPIKRGRLNFFK